MPVERAPNAVLHPWLQQELRAILEELPAPPRGGGGRQAADWAWDETTRRWATAVPPVRVLLIWDNLTGHHTGDLVAWLLTHGIWPLFTPLGGAWLNLAESVQRILVRRALAGQQPASAHEAMTWLAQAVDGWNAAPTPFVWGGKRAARRQRARERRHALAGSGGYTRQPIPRPRQPPYGLPVPNGYVHGI